MTQHLTTSPADRQALLTHPAAVEEIYYALCPDTVSWQGEEYLTKEQAAAYLAVPPATLDQVLSQHAQELAHNGYLQLEGAQRADFLAACHGAADVPDPLEVFSFRAFLNLILLLPEGEPARVLRQFILDMVLDLVYTETEGGTRYLHRPDQDISLSACLERYRPHPPAVPVPPTPESLAQAEAQLEALMAAHHAVLKRLKER